MAEAVDPCSLSNPNEVLVKHWHWSAEPSFSNKTISATIDLQTCVLKENVEKLVLDTRDLNIIDVFDTTTKEKLSYKLQSTHPVCSTFGSALVINLPSDSKSKGSSPNISIKYETSPSGAAVQWLDPVQTIGKQHPYLFTQCQAIHARSLIPCQDTPSVKSTYSAEVTVPAVLTALMSAVRDGESVTSDKKIYRFQQKVPIPSYLVALAVGALESRKIGPRSHVWSEAEVVDKAAYEFAEMEAMIKAAENIVGPFLWGNSDILIPPPSFPYGGMENPTLIFATPTILAGDRSLVTVVAHEIAHSWTGNLVTNINWEHFWLNEGFTRYLERLIISDIQGEDESNLIAMLGWKSLQDAVDQYGESNPLTALVPKLGEIDPDDAFSAVPYEKGFTLLYYLETLVGLEEMKSFLRAYIHHFKYKSLNTYEWKDFFLKHFEDKKDILKVVDWDTWFYAPGMPPFDPKFGSSGVADESISLAERWSQSKDGEEFLSTDLDKLSSSLVQEFLNQLLNKPPLSVEKLMKMEQLYKMNSKTNSEIKFRWLRLCLKGEWTDAFPHTVSFVLEQGRMKFVRPLYRDLFNCPGGGKTLATETFLKNKQIYHGIAAMMIARDLGIDESAGHKI